MRGLDDRVSVPRADLRINQSELVRRAGGSRQQINRVLGALEGVGSIDRAGHRIVAIRPDVLALED